MFVVSSLPQLDGRFWVTETHDDDQTFTYLADVGTDIDAVMADRAAAIKASIIPVQASVGMRVKGAIAKFSGLFRAGARL